MAKYLDMTGLTYLWEQIKTRLSGKVDIVEGKGLSANDYTTLEKNKLAEIEDGANKYIHPTSGVTENTYTKVTVDINGHVTTGSNPTTLSGYGIIDAANKSHTHVTSEITNFPTSLKNPTALSLTVNGTTISYDGSVAQTINIDDNALGVVAITNAEIDTIIAS